MKCPSGEEIKQAIQVWENRTWEFKSVDYLGDPKLMGRDVVDKKYLKLCYDIASFANTSGGHIVIGVDDDRKGRNICGFSIGDTLKNRISHVVRSRISTVPIYDISVTKVDGKHVTVISIDEGDGDLSTVNGTVFIRDVNGRALATGGEITRIVRKRLGKKLAPAPTNKEIMNSPYNLPNMDEGSLAILADFEKVAPSYGFKGLERIVVSHYGVPWVLTFFDNKNRRWYFLVIPCAGDFGPNEYKDVSVGLGDYQSKSERALREHGVPEDAGVYPLILIMGRINSLKSQLSLWGFSFVPNRFGGYAGPGERKRHRPLCDPLAHRFMLSGITQIDVLDKRIDSFIDWLKENQPKLSKPMKPR